MITTLAIRNYIRLYSNEENISNVDFNVIILARVQVILVSFILQLLYRETQQ